MADSSSSSEGLGIIVPFAIYTGAYVTIVGAHAVSLLAHSKVSNFVCVCLSYLNQSVSFLMV